MTIGIYTNNSEKWIGKVIKRIYPYIGKEVTELIIIDNMSTDNTVPIIVETIGQDFMQEDIFKFFINTKDKGYKNSVDKMNKIKTNDKLLVINKNINIRKLKKKVGKLLDDKN